MRRFGADYSIGFKLTVTTSNLIINFLKNPARFF